MGVLERRKLKSAISVTDCDGILGGVSVLVILCKSSAKVLFLILRLNKGVMLVKLRVLGIFWQ